MNAFYYGHIKLFYFSEPPSPCGGYIIASIDNQSNQFSLEDTSLLLELCGFCSFVYFIQVEKKKTRGKMSVTL